MFGVVGGLLCWSVAVGRSLCRLAAVGGFLYWSVAVGWLLWVCHYVGRSLCVWRCGSVALGCWGPVAMGELLCWSVVVGRSLCPLVAVGQSLCVCRLVSVAVGRSLWVGGSRCRLVAVGIISFMTPPPVTGLFF